MESLCRRPNFFFGPRPKKIVRSSSRKKDPPSVEPGDPPKKSQQFRPKAEIFFLDEGLTICFGLGTEQKFGPSAKIFVIFFGGVPWLLRGGVLFFLQGGVPYFPKQVPSTPPDPPLAHLCQMVKIVWESGL